MREAAEETDIGRRMTRIASEYVRFAGEHPHLYAAMNSPALGADDRRRAAEPTVAVVKDLLASWSRAHGVVLADPDEACEIIWGSMHGLAAVGGLNTVGNDRARRLAEEAIRAILLGWRTAIAAAR